MPTTRKITPPAVDPDVQPGGAAWQVQVPGSELVDGADDEASLEEMAIVDRIRATLSQSTEGVSIKLFRVDTFTKKREFCQNYAPHDLENIEERIREQWGAGTFEVKVFNSRGIAPGGRIMVTLAAPTKPLQTAVVQASPIPDAVSMMLAQLADGQAKLAEAIARMGAAAPAPSPQDQMRATLELLTMARSLTQPATPAPAASQMEMMREVFSMVREAKDAARSLTEDEPGSDPDNPMSLIRDFLQTARGVMAQQQPMTAPQLAGPSIPHVTMPASLESDEMLSVQRHIAELESMLTRGEPPQSAAGYLYKWMPVEALPMMQGDSWFALLSSASSILAKNRDWCDQARTLTIQLFEAAKSQGIKL